MGTRLSIADALFSATQQKVLGLLFVHPERSFYTSEVVNHAAMGRGTVQRELDKLEKSGLVTVSYQGNQKHFQANRSSPVFSELKSLALKTFGLRDVLRSAMEPLLDRLVCAFVYGSLARGEGTADSDIDVMLIGNGITMAEAIDAFTPAGAQLGREINPSIYDPAEFRQRLEAGNAFARRVVDGPRIMLHGSLDHVEAA